MGLNSVDPRGSINISNPIGYSKYFYMSLNMELQFLIRKITNYGSLFGKLFRNITKILNNLLNYDNISSSSSSPCP